MDKKLFVVVIAATSLILIAVVVAFASGVLQQSSLSPSSSSPAMQNDKIGFYTGTDNGSLIVDQRGDARPDKQYKTSTVPAVMGYHDILWAGVRKIDNSGAFLLTAGLAGDPNMNEKYETTYVWHIITSTHVYTAILPNFAPDSNFAAKGWYFAVYNNTREKYIVPMTRISDMPKDRVEFPLEASLIGNPQSFHYWVSVHVRVDAQNLDKPPDYLMDYAP
ncbi:hypothetical protein NWT39_14220 [Nitrososphaera viennensis]|uniref:Uncharacterized protein n=1 Tax=Nitrososphaera viennensis TaxID=1034015 RepID=A0A977NLS8_9ARCH|nr:hypothetical protein [Nitrososphaera viennensis]UVS69048.1 hypothetical protein NWT39_14220 [Nitrososphaera viennensis]